MKNPSASSDDILPYYDFRNGVRGKFYRRYREASNVVVLDPDIAKLFPNGKAVNQASRQLAKAMKPTA